MEQLGGLGGKGLVDFHHQLTVGGEVAGGVLSDGAVEKQRVFVGHEEGLGGVVVQYVALHDGAFVFHDVGGIADDEVAGGGEGGELCGVEHVELPEGDVGVVLPGVLLRDGEGGRGEVHGRDGGLWEMVFQCNGYAAASGAEVEDGTGFEVGVAGEAGDDFLCLRTGYEYIGRHVDAEAAKVCEADDVLYGTVVLEVFGGPVESQQVRLVDGVVAVQQELGFVPAEESLEKHVDKHAQLPFGVEGAEFGEVVTLDVAHAVGGDVHVGGVHVLRWRCYSVWVGVWRVLRQALTKTMKP